jgi:hypothetical protein
LFAFIAAAMNRPICTISLLAVILCLPAFVLGPAGGDLHCNSLWMQHFSRQFWHGDLYPRWLIDMYAGNGRSYNRKSWMAGN